MIRYILKRLLQAFPLLLGIITITFVMIRIAPGDPMEMYREQRQGQGREMDPEVIELMRKRYGLDQPAHHVSFSGGADGCGGSARAWSPEPVSGRSVHADGASPAGRRAVNAPRAIGTHRDLRPAVVRRLPSCAGPRAAGRLERAFEPEETARCAGS